MGQLTFNIINPAGRSSLIIFQCYEYPTHGNEIGTGGGGAVVNSLISP